MAPKALAVLALLGVGCATPSPSWRQRPPEELEAHVRHLAAQDFQCPERDVFVSADMAFAMTTEGCIPDVHGVTAMGCGREARYDFDAQDALRLKLILPGGPELRQWVEEVLQAQPPDTTFALGKFTPEHGAREQEVLFFPTQSGARWKLAVRLIHGSCDDASMERMAEAAPQPDPGATAESTSLGASTCGGVFRVFVAYSGPPALMPAPRGLHLQHIADAIAAKLSEANKPRLAAPTPAPAPARAPAR
jgi:hypothetical protein